MEKGVEEKLQKFFSQFKNQQYRKGEILIRADEPPRGVFYLRSGLVRQYAIARNGTELTVNIYKPGTFFPMMWVINNRHNPHYFEATAVSQVYQAPKHAVLKFLKDESDVVYDLVQRVYIGLEGLLQKVEYLMTGDAYSKLVIELLIAAKRFGEKNEKGTAITIPLAHHDLAHQIGITRETVSRGLGKLKKKDIIEYSHHKVIIHSMRDLEDELG